MQKAMSDLHNDRSCLWKSKSSSSREVYKERIQASKEREVINIYNPLNSSLSLR